MKKIKVLFAALVISSMFFVSCEDDSSSDFGLGGTNHVSLELSKSVRIIDGETMIVENKVYASQAPSSDLVLDLYVDAASTADATYYSVPATVTIPAGATEATFNVEIEAVNLGFSGKTIIIGITPKAGIDLDMGYTKTTTNGVTTTTAFQNNKLTITAKQRCDFNLFRIQIVTDAYGSETTWQLYDSAGTEVASGGPYADVAGDGGTFDQCLPDGDYTFVAYDSYGDGMYDGSNQGYYKLVKMDAEGNEATVVAQDGTFGAFEAVTFSLP